MTFPTNDYVPRQLRKWEPPPRLKRNIFKPGRLTLHKFMERAAFYGRKKGKLCSYCLKRQSVTDDHVIPRARGGKRENNIVPACVRCNGTKGTKSLLGFVFGVVP